LKDEQRKLPGLLLPIRGSCRIAQNDHRALNGYRAALRAQIVVGVHLQAHLLSETHLLMTPVTPNEAMLTKKSGTSIFSIPAGTMTMPISCENSRNIGDHQNSASTLIR